MSTPSGSTPTLGKRLFECRYRLGWTQKTLGDKTGLSVTFLSELENDHRLPGSGTLIALGEALGASLDYLVMGIPHEAAEARIAELEQALALMRTWIDDLQSGMYVNCVYCGHRYGSSDEVPATMADVLKAHVEGCPKHPMSALKAENTLLRQALDKFAEAAHDVRGLVSAPRDGT